MRATSRVLPARSLWAIVAVLALAASTLVAGAVNPESASAASASQFQPGNIINDETFFKSNALTTSQIQDFISGKGTACTADNGLACLKNYRATTPSLAATRYCGAYVGAANETAAQIIQRVGATCGINPEVLITLLEKEQGLVSSTAPTSRMYRSAMGYGCPDTADCDTAYYGFFNQVYNSASQFQRYTKTSSAWRYRPGQWNNVQWHPNAACGSSPVWIENQATANLYIYTPYQPNSAAMANLYGTGDNCSSYGNRNFFRIFSDWFGSPTGGRLSSPSFEGGTNAGWGTSNGFMNQQVALGPDLAQDGDYFLATNTAVAGRAITQDVTRTTSAGEQVTAKVWVRSATGDPYSGTLALWGLGGTANEQSYTDFTATGTWQEITVVLPIRKSTHSTIRLDVYLRDTTDSLWVDNTSMVFGTAPPVQNLLNHGSFEGSFGDWKPGNGFMNQQIYNDAALAKDRSWFAATNTPAVSRSFAQTIPASGEQNDRYTFSIWLRAAEANKPFNGRVALWGFGGSANVVNATTFSVNSEWQEVSVTVDVTKGNINQLKAEVYLDSTNGTLWMDDGQVAKNLLTAGSFEGGESASWGSGNGATNFAVYGSSSTNPAAQGSYFAEANSSSLNSSLAQIVQRKVPVGDRYTAEVWVRSADTSKTFTGTLALWALGGSTEAASVPFTATAAWQKVQVKLPINVGNHTQLKFEIYLGSLDNALFLDGAQIY